MVIFCYSSSIYSFCYFSLLYSIQHFFSIVSFSASSFIFFACLLFFKLIHLYFLVHFNLASLVLIFISPSFFSVPYVVLLLRMSHSLTTRSLTSAPPPTRTPPAPLFSTPPLLTHSMSIGVAIPMPALSTSWREKGK
jgi:hypothetical protein